MYIYIYIILPYLLDCKNDKDCESEFIVQSCNRGKCLDYIGNRLQ